MRKLGSVAVLLGAILVTGPSSVAVDAAYCIGWCQMEYHQCMALHGGYGPYSGGWVLCGAQQADCFALCGRLVAATNQAGVAPVDGTGSGSPFDRFLRDVATAGPAPPTPVATTLMPRAGVPRRSLGKHGRRDAKRTIKIGGTEKPYAR